MMIIGLILILFIFFNFNKDRNVSFSSHKSPELKLKERFITGEIDEDTYLKMLEIIRK